MWWAILWRLDEPRKSNCWIVTHEIWWNLLMKSWLVHDGDFIFHIMEATGPVVWFIYNHCIIFSEIHQPRSQQKVEVDAGYEKAMQVKKVGLGTPHFWRVFILTLFDAICFTFHWCSFIGVLKLGSSHAGQANRHGVCGARCFASPAPWSWEKHGKTQVRNSKPGFRMISYSIHVAIFFETIQPCLPIVLHFLFRRISEINKSYQVICHTREFLSCPGIFDKT